MDRTNNSELSEYLSNEITQYYGEDTLRSIEQSVPPTYPAIHKKNKIISVLSIGCAILFLTGASMLFGIIFTSGIPFSEITSGKPDETTSICTDKFNLSENSPHEHSSNDFSKNSSQTDNVIKQSEDTPKNIGSLNNTKSDNSRKDRTDSTSQEILAEYPKDNSFQSNINNNNITTGRRIRTGTGSLLMILSLITALVLHSQSKKK